MELVQYQVDAFSAVPFAGNPAAVIKLDAFLPDALMQSIAAENNLSETAFVVPKGDHYDLRWFTPTVEIRFCGHATIATAHVLASVYDLPPPFTFTTQIGDLSVTHADGRYALDAPAAPAKPVTLTPAMQAAFDCELIEGFAAADNLYLIAAPGTDIGALRPVMSDIIPLSDHGVGISAQSGGEFDFISRFFVPAEGIDEDPVTGSAHAALAPYWADKLSRTELRAFQASQRGGALDLSIKGDRVLISGPAITVNRAVWTLPQ